jgi:hypothetical protein
MITVVRTATALTLDNVGCNLATRSIRNASNYLLLEILGLRFCLFSIRILQVIPPRALQKSDSKGKCR